MILKLSTLYTLLAKVTVSILYVLNIAGLDKFLLVFIHNCLMEIGLVGVNKSLIIGFWESINQPLFSHPLTWQRKTSY